MSTAKVDIWNLALSHVRAQHVGGTTEKSAAALQCRTYYETCKSMVLSESPWKFATRWVSLPRYYEKPQAWNYSFQLPAGWLRIWRLRHDEGWMEGIPEPNIERYWYEIPYDLQSMSTDEKSDESQMVLTDAPQVAAKLTFDVDEGKFTAPFTMALSHLLASYIAKPLAGLELGVGLANNQYKAYLNVLAATNAGESSQQNIEIATPRYLSARW